MTPASTYFDQADEKNGWLCLQVHLQAAVELLSDLPHVLTVARLPENSLCRRPFFPQQHQHFLHGRGWELKEG